MDCMVTAYNNIILVGHDPLTHPKKVTHLPIDPWVNNPFAAMVEYLANFTLAPIIIIVKAN